jgi:hypothetical protein
MLSLENLSLLALIVFLFSVSISKFDGWWQNRCF